jgi:hypothetical protein
VVFLADLVAERPRDVPYGDLERLLRDRHAGDRLDAAIRSMKMPEIRSP